MTPPPFERLPHESPTAFAAFCLFVNSGPDRSLAAVALKLGKNERLLKRWAKRYDWSGRVATLAGPLDALEREAAATARANATDLLKLAGLTYRQLHGSQIQAALPTSLPACDAGQPKLTAEQVLALCVCASLRRDFSLPLEKLGGLFAWMMVAPPGSLDAHLAARGQEYLKTVVAKAEHLRSLEGLALKKALRNNSFRCFVSKYIQAKLDSLRDCPIRYSWKCMELGETVYLYTDFQASMMLFEPNLAAAIVQRFPTGPVVIFPLNRLVDELRTGAGKPRLPRDRFRRPLMERWKELHTGIPTPAPDHEIFRLMMEKGYLQ